MYSDAIDRKLIKVINKYRYLTYIKLAETMFVSIDFDTDRTSEHSFNALYNSTVLTSLIITG